MGVNYTSYQIRDSPATCKKFKMSVLYNFFFDNFCRFVESIYQKHMKKQFFKALLLGFLVTAFFACKKENLSPTSISGMYNIYELENQKTGEVEALPNDDGQSSKINVTLSQDRNTAEVKLYLSENGKETLLTTVSYSVSKDEDGDYSLIDENKKLMAFFIDNEADFYFVPGYRMGGKK
jgi:hypothetical protein